MRDRPPTMTSQLPPEREASTDGVAQESPSKRRRGSEQESRTQKLTNLLSEVASELRLNSPSVSYSNGISCPSGAASNRELELKCEIAIKWLFWQDSVGLDSCLSKFRLIANPKGKTASALLRILTAQIELSESPSKPKLRYNSKLCGTEAIGLSFGNTTSTARLGSATTSFTSNNSAAKSSIFSHTSSGLAVSAQTSFNEASFSLEDPFVSAPKSQKAVGIALDAKQPQRTSMEHYQVRDLPDKGFFVKQLPLKLCRASERVRYECVRLTQSCNLDIDKVAEMYTHDWEDYDVLWTAFSQLTERTALPSKVSSGSWKAAGERQPHLIRSARFNFGKKSNGELFHFSLEPVQQLPGERTRRLSRHFSADRFLKLEIPLIRELTGHLAAQEANIRTRIRQWCAGPPKELAGCMWRVFFVRDAKDKRAKSTSKKKREKAAEYEVFLFAENGHGMEEISVGDMLQWFLPFENNCELSLHKAFARIELGLSKTFSTWVFKPSEIRWAADIKADGTLGDVTLDDPLVSGELALSTMKHDPAHPCVMNDGCARISPGAAKRVWNILRQPGPCPSVFQGRIGPWKGVWMVSAAPGPRAEDEDIWLEVTPSQRKFMPHDVDRDDSSFDEDRLTFEVLTWSTKSSESSLYKDYLPILEDRGVSKDILSEFVTKTLDVKREEFFDALGSTTTLYRWAEGLGSTATGSDTENHQFSRGMPSKLGSRVTTLLRAGFDTSSYFLMRQVKQLATAYFKRISAEFDIPLPQSTNVFGVADPLQCLGPDEIHLAFSSLFGDEPFPYLDKVDALVARHPALKRSDMQRVRIVYKEQLRHLLDVVVFPTHGCVPLAGKLQGGDYDGDKFWVCWATKIVEPFRNIQPQHSSTLTPESFGIEVDRTKIGDVYSRNESLEAFVSRGIEAALKKQQLGTVTRFHEKLRYVTNSIATKEAETVADLHDFLVDSSKNGYSFSREAWVNFKRSSLKTTNWQRIDDTEPAYEKAGQSILIDSTANDSDKVSNIVDFMIFRIAWNHTKETIKSIESFVSSHQKYQDEALSRVYLDSLATQDCTTKAILKALKMDIIDLCGKYEGKRAKIVHDHQLSAEDRSSRLRDNTQKAREAYVALVPVEEAFKDDPSARRLWHHRLMPGQLTSWELVKASAIFTLCTKAQDFVFDCAGNDLCYIKANSLGRAAVVVHTIFSNMKMRKGANKGRPIVSEAEGGYGNTDSHDEDGDGEEAQDEFCGFVHGDYENNTEDDSDDDVDSADAFEAIESVSQRLESSSLESPKKRRLDA